MNTIQKKIHVTADWISQYASSIEAPLQTTMDGNLIAPATMPVIFWQEFDIPWINMRANLIHGIQRFSYESMLTSGMILDCELSLTNVERKAGRQGELTFYTHRLVCTCEGELIVTAETVLIRVGEEDEETNNV
ncbi:MaoC family dehydratase N-terminal domain-containing protein [Paenibacillus sp. GCM10028914]|uniref:FAS1-like dehydratase domain-containing protein n=1 Tax=Paenibacillus sp. GCM10028914 TaxID=3273416 RepID=UPI0036149B44